MNNFDFGIHTKYYFGRGNVERIGNLVSLHSKKILLVYGGGSVKRSGLYERIVKSLASEDIAWFELPGVQPNPRLSLVRKGIELCKKEGIDFILAVGGGSVIDTSKAISLGALYDGDVWDYFCGHPYEKSLPIGVVLTIPAAGSESSKDAVITNEELGLKRASCNSEELRPIFAILDPEVTLTLPKFQTFCGVMDIMAHVMERYFTNTENVDLTDRLCEAVLQSAMNAANKLLENPHNYEARAQIMWCGTIAHNGICGLDREGDWGSHTISHEISALYDKAHGATLSVIFPAWMKYTCSHNFKIFAQFANRVFGVPYCPNCEEEMAYEGIRRLESFIQSIDLPLTFKELGIDEPDIVYMADKCTDNGSKTVSKFVKLNRADIIAIYKSAL